MQLSKREFSQLSKKDQLRLASRSSKPLKGGIRKKGPRNTGSRTITPGKGNLQRLETAPSAFSRKVVQMRPVERTKPNGVRCIHFKEYVQDIAGSVAFAVTQFQCNPGLSNLFAWLSTQSLFYQEYSVKGLKFTFETEKATTLSGKVMYAFLQDSSDPAPASKQEMLENLMKASGAIWEPFNLPISMSNFPALGKSRFVRSGNLAANLDVKTYDIGQLVVATQGMADTSLVGELYIEYDLELRTPIQSSAQLASAFSAKVLGVAPSNVSLFGVTPTIVGGLNVSATVNTITFNTVGQYLVTALLSGTVMNTSFNPVTGTSTASAITNIQGISNAAANAGTVAMFTQLVTVTARGQTAVFDCTTQCTTLVTSAVRIAVYSATNA